MTITAEDIARRQKIRDVVGPIFDKYYGRSWRIPFQEALEAELLPLLSPQLREWQPPVGIERMARGMHEELGALFDKVLYEDNSVTRYIYETELKKALWENKAGILACLKAVLPAPPIQEEGK